MVIVAQFGFLSVRPDEMRFAAFLKTNIFGPKSMKKLYIAYTIGNVVLVKPLQTFPNCQKGLCTPGR